MIYGWEFHSIIFWAAIVLIVLISSFFKSRSRIAKYKLLQTLAEKGQTLSPELLASVGTGRGDRPSGSPVSSGIFLMCIGIALAVFFWAMDGGGNPFMGDHVSWLPVIGIFPFMIGLARVLTGITEGRSSK
jgi:hypothetical protein